MFVLVRKRRGCVKLQGGQQSNDLIQASCAWWSTPTPRERDNKGFGVTGKHVAPFIFDIGELIYVRVSEVPTVCVWVRGRGHLGKVTVKMSSSKAKLSSVPRRHGATSHHHPANRRIVHGEEERDLNGIIID